MRHLHVVTLKGMRFQALIGTLPHESELPQPLEIDLSVSVERPDGPDEDVLDYRRLYDMVAKVAGEGHVRFIEEVVDRVSERVLTLPEVRSVRVAARKLHVALPGPLEYAEVTLERWRE